jgi:beta-lactamase class D
VDGFLLRRHIYTYRVCLSTVLHEKILFSKRNLLKALKFRALCTHLAKIRPELFGPTFFFIVNTLQNLSWLVGFVERGDGSYDSTGLFNITYAYI